MEGRGRKSSAALSVVPTALPQRIEPPAALNKAEASLWRAVVAGKPVDWFTADTAPLLVEYVRASDLADRLAVQIEAAMAGSGDISLKDLLLMRDREAKRIASIATKLRLTQQSRYTPQAASTASRKASGGKPWLHGNS